MAINLHLPAHLGSRLALLGRALVFVAAGVGLLILTPLRAQTPLYWDTNGAAAGATNGTTANGIWGTNNFWNTSSAGTNATGAWVSGDIAEFAAGTNATAASTVTVNGTIAGVAGIVFDASEGPFTLTGGTLTLTGTPSINVAAATATISSVLAGTVGMTKAGGGTLVLSGTNTYTGVTTISGGVLSISADRNLGAVPGAATAGSLTLNGGTLNTSASLTLSSNRGIAFGASGGTVDVNSGTTLTYGGIIAGNGSLTKANSGTLLLSGVNTYTGATNINAGILNIQNNAALGAAAGIATVSSGATLQMQGGLTGVGEALTLNGTGTTTNGALENLSGANTLTGAITLAGATRINSDAGTLTLSGNIGGATQNLTVGGSGNSAISGVIGTTTGALTKDGTGTLTLSGANTYTGATNINVGILRVQNAGALGTAANTANTTVASGATLQLVGGITTTNSGTLVINGTGTGSGALQNVSGNNTWNGSIALASDATIFSATAGNILYIDDNYVSAQTLTMGNHTLTVDGPGDTWFNANAGVAGDTGGLVKNGTGKLTLYGYNTFYTGATNVNAGSLDLIVGPFTPGWYGINGALTIGTGPANPALAGTVNVNIATNSYADQISPTSAVTINSDGALNVGAATSLGSLTLNGGQVNITNGIALTPTGSITANTNSAHQTSLISGGSLTLAGSTTFNVARDATNASDLTVSSIVGGGALVKQGAGVLTLSGANTYTGATTVSAGVLNIQNNTALGTAASGTTVASGAALQTQGNITVAGEALTLNGFGVSNDGALRNISGNNTWTGAVTLGSASRINSDAGTLTLAGGLGGSGQNLTVGGAGNTVISGSIGTTTGTLTKDGTGVLTLSSAANLSSAALVLNGGTLALGTGTSTFSSLSVTANSILDFGLSGSSILKIINSVTVDSGMTLTIQNWTDTVDYFYSLVSPGPTNLGRIVFSGFPGATKWQPYDTQITPVPESSVYGAVLLGLSALFATWRLNRRRTS